MALEGDIFLEIRLSIVGPHGICSKERNIHLLHKAVVHRVTGLDVMISNHDSIIADVLHHSSEKMLGLSVYIIIIVGRIIALQTISCINQDHIIFSDGRAYAVHIP